MAKINHIIIAFASLILSTMLCIGVFVSFVVRQYHYDADDTIIMGYAYYFPGMFLAVLITKEILKRGRVFQSTIFKFKSSITVALSMIAIIIYGLLPITHLIDGDVVFYIDLLMAYIFGTILYFKLYFMFIKVDSW